LRFYGFPKNYGIVAAHAFSWRRNDGEEIAATEAALARYIGSKHVILAPQGRVGLHLAVKALVKPGQKVLMSPYTLYDVVNMVISVGAIPVFVDVEPRTGNIDPQEVLKHLAPDVGAVLITHLHGIAADVRALQPMCAQHGVPMIEDACQAFGAAVGGRKLGTIGEIGVFSTGRAKNLNSFLGGFVVTDDDRLAVTMRNELGAWPAERGKLYKRIAHCLLADTLTMPPVFGLATFWVFREGILRDVAAVTRQFDTEVNPVCRTELPERYKRRMSGLQAKLIFAQLGKVEENTRMRLQAAAAYHEGLRDIDGLVMPPFKDNGENVYLSYPIQVADRLDLQKFMARHYRDVTIQHIGNTADYKAFRHIYADCPVARKVADSVLLLPTYPGYGAEEVAKNVEVIRRYFYEKRVSPVAVAASHREATR
jgi:dTDP-4-amino-4,6-dideoxygalactose transaminase